MKYIINAAFSDFRVPQQVQQALGCGVSDNCYEIRTNPYFIKWVEANANESELVVVEIPDEATDWDVIKHDGFESIIAVVDGKIQYIE